MTATELAQRMEVDAGYLEALVSIIQRAIPEFEVWVFGSRVNGDHHETSDIDLVILGKGVIADLGRIIAFKTDLDESDIPYLVDVVQFDHLDERMQDDIKQAHLVLHTPS